MRYAVPWLPIALAILALSACAGERDDDDGPQSADAPPRTNVFAQMLALPGSEALDTTGTREAQRIDLAVAQPIDTVRAFYQRFLTQNGWTVRSNTGDSEEATIHAKKDTLLVWIVARAAGPSRTIYQLIGASERPDSTRPPPDMMPRPR